MFCECHLRDTRRAFLRHASVGIGSAALSAMLARELAAQEKSVAAADGAGDISTRWPGVLEKLHHPAKAKRVIFLCMAGGPSHLETFDYKPKLAEMNGQPMPESFTHGQPIAQLQGQALKCLGPQHAFKQFGNSGRALICA